MKIFLEENYELVQDGSPIFNLMAKDRGKKIPWSVKPEIKTYSKSWVNRGENHFQTFPRPVRKLFGRNKIC